MNGINTKIDGFLFVDKIKSKASFWRNISICLLFMVFASIINSNKNAELKKHGDYIAKVKISGEINNYTFDEKRLDSLKDDDNIKAVILEIDSPGGEVVPSEILYTRLKEISSIKPVVTTIKGLGASGAYMVALASEYIVAYNTSLVGSIGVLFQSANISNSLDKIGVKVKLYKSSKLKASPNVFEETNEEVDSVIREKVNDMYSYFLDIFMTNRKINRRDAMDIANGQVYTGRQALNFKLIDKIGDTNDLISYLKDKGVETEDIFYYDITLKDTVIKKMIKSFSGKKMVDGKKLLFLYN